jgi:hypothetical protein
MIEASYDRDRQEYSFRNFVADMLLYYYLIKASQFFELLGKE